MAACRCGGPHGGSQHDYLERLDRKLGINPRRNVPVATPELPFDTCQHNQGGEYNDGSPCQRPAAVLVSFTDYQGGKHQEFYCDELSHVMLVLDQVADYRVYRLQDVTGEIYG